MTATTNLLFVAFLCVQGILGQMMDIPGINLNSLAVNKEAKDIIRSNTIFEDTSRPKRSTRRNKDSSTGNFRTVGDIVKSDVQFDFLAEKNTAESKKSDLNVGNILLVKDVIDSDLEVSQESEGNSVFTEKGVANSGNIATFDSLFSRKLLEFDTSSWI